jgi:hypothetical protein
MSMWRSTVSEVYFKDQALGDVLRKYHHSLRDSPEEGSSLLFYSTCLEQHFLARLRINPLNTELNPICHQLALLGAHHILHVSRIRVKRKHCTYMSRFQVRRSPAAFVVQARSSLDKTQVMLSTETIKEIAKFDYLITTLTNKPDKNILLGYCCHFLCSYLCIYLFICDF